MFTATCISDGIHWLLEAANPLQRAFPSSLEGQFYLSFSRLKSACTRNKYSYLLLYNETIIMETHLPDIWYVLKAREHEFRFELQQLSVAKPGLLGLLIGYASEPRQWLLVLCN